MKKSRQQASQPRSSQAKSASHTESHTDSSKEQDVAVADQQETNVPAMVQSLRQAPLNRIQRQNLVQNMGEVTSNRFVQRTVSQPTVRQGSNGEAVQTLQQQLNAKPYIESKLTADGSFGARTHQAVVTFQQHESLDADGVVGPRSWGALLTGDNATGGGTNPTTTTLPGKTTTPGGGTSTTGGSTTGGSTTPATGDKTATPGGTATTGGGGGTPAVVGPEAQAKEAEFAQAGQEALASLGSGGGTGPGGGHSEARKVEAFPEWFNGLQDALIGRKSWGDVEEKAQHLLRDYARFWVQSHGGKKVGNLDFFFEYLGRSQTNATANANYSFKKGKEGEKVVHAGELGGTEGGANWCAAASRGVLQKALAAKGLGFKGGIENWYKKFSKKFLAQGDKAFSEPLRPGDIISLIGKATPVSGHVGTIIQADGDSIMMISGNAGGKAIRIDQVSREMPPSGYNWLQNVMDHTPKQAGVNAPATSGKIWTVVVEHTSELDPEQVDPNNQEQLDSLGLAKKN